MFIFLKVVYVNMLCEGFLGMGVGVFGIGDWVLGPIPKPQSPIPMNHKTCILKKFLNLVIYNNIRNKYYFQ